MQYNIKSDLHTHTIYSHGKNDIEYNVLEAINKGLKTIAITDHGPGHVVFGMHKKNIKIMRDEIDRLNEKYKEIDILYGIEANLMTLSGETDIYDEHLKYYDIVLMGYHKLGFKLKDMPSFLLAPMLWKQKYADKFAYSYKKAMERYPIDIITHPGYGIYVNMELLSQFAAKNKVALEVNNSHMSMSEDDIKIALKNGAMLTVNSDAHIASKVGCFERALSILEKAQVPAQRILNTLDKPVFRNNRSNVI